MIKIDPPDDQTDIDDVYVCLAIDDQGRRGICAANSELGVMPMLTGDPLLVETMKVIAERLTKETGQPIELYRFRRDEKPIFQCFAHTARDIMEAGKK